MFRFENCFDIHIDQKHIYVDKYKTCLLWLYTIHIVSIICFPLQSRYFKNSFVRAFFCLVYRFQCVLHA